MNENQTNVRYLPLGDSYTIGEGVGINENFPSLLTQKLQKEGLDITIVAQPAVTGYTTQDILDHQIPLLASLKPNFCTLLIGVNDWVQEVPIEIYHENLERILTLARQQVGDRLLLLSIPDFSVSKEGVKYSKGRDIARGIEAFNKVGEELAQQKNIPLVNIFSLSQRQKEEAYFAADQLHPSAKAYEEWVSLMFPVTLNLLSPFRQSDE